jgi:hypothetical protein
MNYRKLWEDANPVPAGYYQEGPFKIPDDHEIHHLDHNHENNELSNLVCIPRRIHRVYHMHYNILQSRLPQKSLPWVAKDIELRSDLLEDMKKRMIHYSNHDIHFFHNYPWYIDWLFLKEFNARLKLN